MKTLTTLKNRTAIAYAADAATVAVYDAAEAAAEAAEDAAYAEFTNPNGI